MVIKKLNSVFHKHSRLLFGIFALLIIVAFTPGIMDGCNQDPGKQTAGTVMDEKVTYSDLAQFMPKTQVALALLIDDSNRMPTDDEHRFMLSQLMGKKDARQLDYNELLYLYAMEKYAENIGISVSDKEIADMVKTLPAVQTNGNFDTAKFNEFMSRYNDESVDAAVRLLVTMKKLYALNDASNNVSDKEVKSFTEIVPVPDNFVLEICQLDLDKFKVAAPNKNDLQKFYNDNKKLFVKDNKQLSFKESIADVRNKYVLFKKYESAAKLAENLQKMTDRKAAAKQFAGLKNRGKLTTIIWPDENIMQDMNKFMLIAPIYQYLSMLNSGDIMPYNGLDGSVMMVRVAKRTPMEKEKVKAEISKIKKEQAWSRIQAEIQKMCKVAEPEKAQAE